LCIFDSPVRTDSLLHDDAGGDGIAAVGIEETGEPVDVAIRQIAHIDCWYCRAKPAVITLAILLFDIDGTLIRTGRAGSRAMNRAFEDLFGIAGAFDGIPMAGRTDTGILEEGALRAGNRQRFRDRYLTRLLEALPESRPHASAPFGILPGVQRLLEAIAARDDVFPALLTGNCEEGARIKLQYFDLWKFFRCGAFGDEATDRNHLFDVALERTVASGAPRVPARDIIVVGDTVLDVACAKAAGARSVAVATGPADAATLRSAGADVVVEDLTDTEGFLRLLSVQT
jgi:phosphoglycolate phosphatase